MMKRLRIPLLTAGGVVLCAFVLIPMAFDTLDIGPEIVEVSKSMLHMPSPTPTAEVAENFAITAAAPKAAAEAPSKYRLLKLGDTDPVVADIHERLAELQYMDGDEPSEYFGEPIEAALKRFQRIHHMKETGEADELTQEMLFSDKAAMYKLQQGDEGEDVESLQERLQDLGYEVEKTNGYFGVATVKALSSFQKKNKLDATGVMDTDTADILYSNNARPKVDPTPSPTPKPKSTPTAKPAKTPKISATPKVGNESIGTTKTADPGAQIENTPKTGGGGNVSAATGSVDGFIATAMAQQGKPYITADEGPDSFDCSGLVYYCLSNNGVKVGRMSAKSYAVIDSWETVYSTSDLRPGDLLFFNDPARNAGKACSHAGIYIGNGQFIHSSSSSSGGVIISDLTSGYYNTYFVGGIHV